jgi:hypothetical protein
MRKNGIPQEEVARRFKLSPSRIYLIERRDTADRSMCERRAKLREEIRAADDLQEMWCKKRLMDHFVAARKRQISLRELMDMCLDAPMEGREWMSPPLYRVRGVGKMGFWSVVNGLTVMDLGTRCNEEWQMRLAKVKEENQVTGATPYSSTAW